MPLTNCEEADHQQYGWNACPKCNPPKKGPVTTSQAELLREIARTTMPNVPGRSRSTLISLMRRKLIEGTDRFGWKLTPAGREVLNRENNTGPKPTLSNCLRELRQHIVFDEEGDLTRAEFDQMLARCDRVLPPVRGAS